jgi:hypothetical protein
MTANDSAPRPLVTDAHRALCRALHADAAHRAQLAMERAGVRQADPERRERERVQHNARVRRWYQEKGAK